MKYSITKNQEMKLVGKKKQSELTQNKKKNSNKKRE
jgi:hypothetical protein